MGAISNCFSSPTNTPLGTGTKCAAPWVPMLSHHRRPLSILLSRYLPGISVLLSIALAMLVTRSLVSTGIPYLTKKSIDQYIPTRNINGITELAGLCAVFLVTACVAELIQALALRKIAPTILGHF